MKTHEILPFFGSLSCFYSFFCQSTSFEDSLEKNSDRTPEETTDGVETRKQFLRKFETLQICISILMLRYDNKNNTKQKILQMPTNCRSTNEKITNIYVRS